MNTFLYIKRHTVTGLLYFGKTTQDPLEYKGSGVMWKNHLRKHGHHVETIWFCLYVDEQTIRDFAIKFSEQEDIVKSSDWANLIVEDGLYGGSAPGHKKNRKPWSEAERKQRLSTRKQRTVEDINKYSKRFRIVDPAGNIHEGINLAKFCRDHGLTQQLMSKVCKGLHSNHRGWSGTYVF